jgi:hypothetical protein
VYSGQRQYHEDYATMKGTLYFQCAWCPFWDLELAPLIQHFEAVHRTQKEVEHGRKDGDLVDGQHI